MRFGRIDTSFTGRSLRALNDTIGMPAPQRANFWLERLAQNAHRGPRIDTWASARDRAAKAAGISSSTAARIWHRWADMKDVSGEALIRLMVAYESMCEAVERKTADTRNERIQLQGKNAANEGDRSSDLRVGNARA